MDRPSFPAVIDSSLLAAFRSCPRKAELEYFRHWKPQAESVHLVAGKAYADGLEAARRAYWERGEAEDQALAAGIGALLTSYGDFEPPPGSAKTPDRMIGALEYYFATYGFSTDVAHPVKIGSRWGIEFSFAEPLDITHPETGEPIIYSGRADAIVDYAGGLYILDDKTTSSLGASWVRQWGLRSQFTAYTWAARNVGLKPAGVLVRGVSILKTKYEHAQVPTQRSEWEVDRWLRQTHRDVERMIESWESGAWDYNLDHACTEYGGCMFAESICKSPEPERWLPVNFQRRRWDPLTRTETILEVQ